MRTVVALLALAACGDKKAPPVPALAGSGRSALAVVRDGGPADASTQPVELLHTYTSRIVVSSHVMNRSIKAEHLVDKDFSTAWNSKTGELAGAWIDVSVASAQIHELRLTVGHTGKGPKGEDYFTMNPRITKVAILDGATEVASTTLDPEKRELQRISLPHPFKQVRIRIDAVVMGTKKSWKEACISELEAWGLPDAGAVAGHALPIVSVYEPEPPPPPQFEAGKPVDPQAICDAQTRQLQADFDRRNTHRTGNYADEDAPPSCGLEEPITLGALPWKSVARWRLMINEAHGPGTCDLIASTTAGDFVLGEERGCGPWDTEDLALASARTEDIIPGDAPELVVTYRTLRFHDVPLEMLICRYAKDSVSCTRPFQIADEGWAVAPRFAKGGMTLEPTAGIPPATALGPQALDFN